MSILEKLATSLGRRDEVPNQELARQIAQTEDKKAILELVENLQHKNKGIQSDCIKTLYEIAEVKPKLIAGFHPQLTALLESSNNRLQWGAMTALSAITDENPTVMYQALAKIIAVADSGSVVTNDHCVRILVKLCAVQEYAEDAFSLLNERLLKSPTNQLPMYAEMALPIIDNQNKTLFIATLISRLSDIEKESKRIRVEKVIKKANK
ncbi:HEAT repeat domain-containing protein [Flavobacterium humi]|uniref:HEAT repeat domain-containing protein n=1 Tax=Flavobacterium humi TaxID=2562683 RepID=A0A4Z0L9U3_9FLAO|nr:hypothetical protein [Flavobacterium humi]TGD58591.1 hypothetical protein E4635_06670 [Flavobacterium humi]